MSIYISFGLDARSLDSPSVNEENVYQNLFKKCIRFLYSTKDFSMFFSFTANQLQFLKKKHPEFIDLCQELISRNQIEILGGGAYNPIFPLLFPVDRKGQIDELSTQIHKLFGKRPRGMSLYESCWDPSILPSIKSCGIDYLLLDSSLFSKKSLSYIPSGMTVLDKSLDILPLYEHCAPKTTIVPEVYLETLFQNVKNTSSEYHKYIQDRFIHINILQNEITSLLEANYFEKLISIAKETYNDEIQFVLPSLYRKKTQIREPVHINHGIRKEIAEWITDVKEKKQSFTIYDFLQAHTQSRMLYNKMLYVASLVNQFHGDRARKNDAREKLWKAQSAKALLCNENGFFEDSYYRQYIYKSLAEAETIIRNTPQFTESISYFDYDGDGISDYIFRMTGYTAFVSCIGGSIRELSVSNGGSNYADNLGRRAQYDGYFDDYYRGLFVDHVFSPSLIKIYLKNKNVKSGIFPNLKYDEKSFSAKNKEVTLFARAIIPETNQILRIQKKYTASSSGITVQYIVKNESDTPIDAYLALESNIAQTNFIPEKFSPYSIEIISNGEKKETDSLSDSSSISKEEDIQNVSAVQISDADNHVAFVFEVNEPCNFCFSPITFNRPDGDKIIESGMTFFSAFILHIELESKKEIEKTINFSILGTKKKKSKEKQFKQ